MLCRLKLGRPADRRDDVLVAGAPADLPRDGLPDLRLARVRVPVKQPPRGQHHAGRAEAALQPVALLEAALDRVQLAAALQSFHRRYPAAGCHQREHGA
jgi:hypothetical protein